MKAVTRVIKVKEVARALTEQYSIATAKTSEMLREVMKFGAMLIEWENFLGESRGRGQSEGIKSWLERNCPEINYNTAMGYKHLAEKSAAMLGGGVQALAALQQKEEVATPAGEIVTIDAEVIEKREKMLESATSRRTLEQMYLDFMGETTKGRVGRPVGTSGVGYVRRTAVEAATAVVWRIVAPMLKHRGAAMSAIKLLPAAKLEEAGATFREYAAMVEAEIKSRK